MSDDKKTLLEKVRDFESRTGETTDSTPDLWPGARENTANILNEPRKLSEPLSEIEAQKRMTSLTRRGFLVGGAAALIGIFGWRWMPQKVKDDLLTRTFEFNERVSQLFYSPKHLAREFRPDQITPARLNSNIGAEGELDAEAWRLIIRGVAGQAGDLVLTIDDIRRLPRTEMITQFKCIEGWSYIAKWAGVRFSDIAAAFPPKDINGGVGDVTARPDELPPYVYLATPDGQYYVGWDTQAIMHPQTLLAYELNDEPLTPEHGAPLRIASPTKYGIKQIKRIGVIEYTSERPRDYWADPNNGGYDWYSGH